MEISELSPEEKVEFDKWFNLLREMTHAYWRLAILLPFWAPITDRINDIIRGTWGKNIFVPYQNVPLFFPVWANFGAFFIAVGIAFTWFGVRVYMKKWESIATAIIWTAFFALCSTYVTSLTIGIPIEEALSNLSKLDPLGILSLFIFGIIAFIGIRVKGPQAKWLILIYLGLFLILDYGFYRPLYPNFSWMGIDHRGLSYSPVIAFSAYVAVLGIITLFLMAVLSTEKVLRKLALHEVLEHRDKARS